MKIQNKFLALVITLSALIKVTAQPGGSGPPPDGGGGGTTPGVQSIPVDMYVYALAVLAIMLVVFFAKKYKSQKI